MSSSALLLRMALAEFKVTQQLAIRELLDISSLFCTFMEVLFIAFRKTGDSLVLVCSCYGKRGLLVLGNTVQNVPPLCMLSANDVAHLDALPLDQGTRRRPARKQARHFQTFVIS
jgi:hypothetical protein